MLKNTCSSISPLLRRFHKRLSTSAYNGRKNSHFLTITTLSAGVVTSYLLCSESRVHSDAPSSISHTEKESKKSHIKSAINGFNGKILHTLFWGSNRSNTLTPDLMDESPVPSIVQWLDGVALRDLVFHEDHAACVDARGNVYQWGVKYAGNDDEKSRMPTPTLKDKNIIQLKLTEGRMYALSASGRVYAISAEAAKQHPLQGNPTSLSESWWGIQWFLGENANIDFVEITPDAHLRWGEKFTSIEAGNSHLLALTSKGRVFAHPIDMNANKYGQLGFRKFKISRPSVHDPTKIQDIEVELIPKTISDPYTNFSRSSRPSTSPNLKDNLANVNDNDIRFCTCLFEIPILKGIEMTQIATGARSSFARTVNGRVLSWGANEHGQLGLGSSVSVDTVPIPTEVVLWRSPTAQATTRCLDISAGGNLTAFTVEHIGKPSIVDLLMCGNGQWGGLGSNYFSTAQGTPSPVKVVSGRFEYNDINKSLKAITPERVSVSPTGHVLLTLDSDSTRSYASKDLYVWGKNYNFELGNGKKASIAIPINLETSEGDKLVVRSLKADVMDLEGKMWKRGVHVEQRGVTGFSSSAVYWKIL